MSQETKARKSQARTLSQKPPISPETHYEDSKIAQIRESFIVVEKVTQKVLVRSARKPAV